MEEKENIMFVQIVEKYPCLYDYTCPEYSKRQVTEKTWNLVAKAAKLSATQCKEKWKNIRTAFTRAQKKPPPGAGAKKKKYYLEDVMQFVMPFIKSRAQSGNLPSPSGENDHEDETFDMSEAITQEHGDQNTQIQNEIDLTQNEVDPAESQTNITEKLNTETSDARIIKRSKIAYQNARKKFRPVPAVENEADKCFIDYMKKQNDVDADLEFLQSLLPDVKKMDGRRKRKFKTSVLQLIDNTLDEQEDQEQNRTRTPSTVASWNCSLQEVEHTPKQSWDRNIEDLVELTTPASSTCQYY